ncbi:MAG: IgGFc-binding protein [Myxococcota bacterium]
MGACASGKQVVPIDLSVAPDGSSDGAVDSTVALPPCRPGTRICDGNVFAECGANGRTRTVLERCADVCNPGVGCGFCEVGARLCEGSESRICDATGNGTHFGRDCAEARSTCGEDGFCMDACADAERNNSYLGCEYWIPLLPNGTAITPAADLPPLEWRDAFDVRVVVGNAGEDPANVTLTQDGVVLSSHVIEVGESEDIAIPWNADIPANGASYMDVPIRLLADRPVTVALFNPFEYSVEEGFSFSNDASLLFPAHTYQRRFVAAGYDTIESFPGFVSVIATQDTTLRVHPNTTLRAGGPLSGALAAGAEGTFEMVRGQHVVLQGGDVSGTRVDASAPVAVFAGSQCANVPTGFTACDHLESQMPPVETWSTTYIGAAMGEVTGVRRNPVRVFAATDNTTVNITSPPSLDRAVTLDAGDFHEVFLTNGFVVEASQPVLVAQYLPGQQFSSGSRGDPAMVILPPTEQYRNVYPFVAPTSYREDVDGQNFVLLIREPDQAIRFNGEPVALTWTAIGDFEWAILPIDGGAHVLEGDEPFGAFSYGLGSFTSYAYPAGLDLEVVPPQVLM